MTDDPSIAHDYVILDACCVITLYGSGQMEAILRALPKSAVISEYVRDNETLYIRASKDDRTTLLPIELEPFIENGLLEVVGFENEDEENTFINLATQLDEGESATAAIAIHREWAVATDERKCIRILGKIAPYLQVITTPELVKLWADTTEPSVEAIQNVTENIMGRAKYFPRKAHPLYSWWHTHLNP